MNFTTPISKDSSLYLTLVLCADKEEVKQLDKRENIIFLNPNYIVSSYHILLGVNRAFYNKSVGRVKTRDFKKEIIHCLTNETKLEKSLSLHSVDNNQENNFYIVFLNLSQGEIDEILSKLKGNELTSKNYSKLVNEEKLCEAFEISKEEQETENGIPGAIYTRISTKELK